MRVWNTNTLFTRRAAAAAIGCTMFGMRAEKSTERWVVYYSNEEPLAAFHPFSTLIVDSRYPPPLKPLAAQGKKLIGYVSAGEASPDYDYFDELRTEGTLSRPNPNWPGNFSIDIRDARWQERFCERIVPQVLAKGFHGLFLDTLDSALHLEEVDAVRFRGMRRAAVDLISRLRRRHPAVTLIMNRAYSILEDVLGSIDVAFAESVFATYDFARKQYLLVDTAAYKAQVTLLKSALRKRPDLQVFTLDYWDLSDNQGIRQIYKVQRANGFSPYVSAIDLRRIVPEPENS